MCPGRRSVSGQGSRLFCVAEPKVVEVGQVTRVALAAPDHLGREAIRLRKQLFR